MVKIVNFVLASNNDGSITRIVAEYANHLAARGLEVHISWPVFSFWDYRIWFVERETRYSRGMLFRAYRFLKFWWYILFLTSKTAVRSRSLRWQGAVIHDLDSRIQLNRFFILPYAHNLPDADVMLVMQNYFIPRLLFLPESKGKIVGSIHMDYKEAMKDHDVEFKNWWIQFVSIDQRLSIPRFAVSFSAKRSVEELGIVVKQVIPNGINLREFGYKERLSSPETPLRIMLFCAASPAKGQDFGCRVIKKLRTIYAGKTVRFISVGNVKKENRDIFDENLGYVYGKEYVNAYRDSDIFIYPSLLDGFPAPPLEALACGCVLATTRVQGVSDYAVHGINCLVVEPNDVEGMVNNLRRLIEDQSLREHLRQEGLKTAAEYSWERSADKLIRFMDEVVSYKYNQCESYG